MANTGKKIITRLKQIYVTTRNPTGQVKSNQIGSPDYIPPISDLENCPIAYTATCPEMQIHVQDKSVWFEFSLIGSTQNNPAITKIAVALMQDSTILNSIIFTLPHVNFYGGNFTHTTAAGETYHFQIAFLDSNDQPLSTCDAGNFVLGMAF